VVNQCQLFKLRVYQDINNFLLSLENIIDIKRTPEAAQNSRDIDFLLSQAAITCLFNKEEARNIIGRVLVIDPANKIAICIKNFIDTNT